MVDMLQFGLIVKRVWIFVVPSGISICNVYSLKWSVFTIVDTAVKTPSSDRLIKFKLHSQPIVFIKSTVTVAVLPMSSEVI